MARRRTGPDSRARCRRPSRHGDESRPGAGRHVDVRAQSHRPAAPRPESESGHGARAADRRRNRGEPVGDGHAAARRNTLLRFRRSPGLGSFRRGRQLGLFDDLLRAGVERRQSRAGLGFGHGADGLAGSLQRPRTIGRGAQLGCPQRVRREQRPSHSIRRGAGARRLHGWIRAARFGVCGVRICARFDGDRFARFRGSHAGQRARRLPRDRLDLRDVCGKPQPHRELHWRGIGLHRGRRHRRSLLRSRSDHEFPCHGRRTGPRPSTSDSP